MANQRELAQRVLDHLSGWGFSVEMRERIGALNVLWTTFEASLETALWALEGESVVGQRPSTDKTTIGDWIRRLEAVRPRLSDDAQAVLEIAAVSAKDLMDYRHAIAHGWIVPSTSMPMFVRNPGWHGETRARPSHTAHVSVPLLDMAIECAWTLCRVVHFARGAANEPGDAMQLIALRPEVDAARSMANELRHLTELMNHEKC